nr:phage-like element PBSX protein XkdB [Bacillales bacterium]
MPSYPFMTYSGLLEPKHYKRIGSAIWLFLWCISSTTKEIEKDGITWGIVLGNKPMRLSELAEIFGVNEKTIRRWLEALEQHEYIRITRAPYGLILSVKNSKKFKERVDKNVQSERDRTKMSEPERTNVSNHSDKNVHSNKDITEDIINITDDNKDPIDFIADRFKDLKTIQAGKPSYPTAKDYEAIAQIVVLGVPLPITIKLLEQCFEDFKRNNPKKTITSFNYCKKYIEDKYEALLARERAKEARPNPRKSQKLGVKKDKLPPWIEAQSNPKPIKDKPESPEEDKAKRERMESLLKQLGEWDEIESKTKYG